MTKAQLRTSRNWSNPIHDWLLNHPESGSWSKSYKARRKRIATDPRLQCVAIKLEQLTIDCPDALLLFLEKAAGLPDVFINLQRTQSLQHAAEIFHDALEKGRDIAELHLSTTDQSVTVGQENYITLLNLIETIRTSARLDSPLISMFVPNISRKSKFGLAIQIFCCRELVNTARRIFKKPLHSEVSLLVQVSLNLNAAIPLSQIKARGRRR